MAINKVTLIGNIGKLETASTSNGQQMAKVSLATSESWRDKQTGEKKEHTEWHRVVIYGKLAEIVGQYCDVGTKLYVQGKLQTRKWQDKEGNDRYTTEVVLSGYGGEVEILTPKGEKGHSPTENGHNGSHSHDEAPIQVAQDTGFDDEIPF